ncbi:hypothetical protein [Pedobacter panaciterrae]
MFKIFLTKRSVNEATDFYIGLIERAVASIGKESRRISHINEIANDDIVITVEAKDFVKVQLFKRLNKKINWFQGITPEEAVMMFNSRWRKVLWEIFERITLSQSALNLFVSLEMRRHYKTKYGYRGGHDLIVPCYNKHLSKESFFIKEKYTTPSFVYAGSLATWQCIDEMIRIYKGVEEQLPNATITVLTSEQDKAIKLLEGYGIKNYSVSFCKLEDLDKELSRYKYGFIIREDHIVNRVATPTKMNSYLASGIIPIFSDVVQSFKENITLEEIIRIDPGDTNEMVVSKIVMFEKNKIINPDTLYINYSLLFENYYNDDIYIDALGKQLINL